MILKHIVVSILLFTCNWNAYAGKPAARMGDLTAHGGTIIMGDPTVLIGGMPAARMGDMHVCPMVNPGYPPIPHVGGPIIQGNPTVLIGGMPAARVGDLCTCVGPPDVIVTGCNTVLIGDVGQAKTDDSLRQAITDIEENESPGPPTVFELNQNYPNPFNPSTVISYQVGASNHSPVHVDLDIYNLIGQKVATLVSERQSAGQYQVEWDASDLASGVYIYQLRTSNGFIRIRKLILLR